MLICLYLMTTAQCGVQDFIWLVTVPVRPGLLWILWNMNKLNWIEHFLHSVPWLCLFASKSKCIVRECCTESLQNKESSCFVFLLEFYVNCSALHFYKISTWYIHFCSLVKLWKLVSVANGHSVTHSFSVMALHSWAQTRDTPPMSQIGG
jgi:hypothetical protein